MPSGLAAGTRARAQGIDREIGTARSGWRSPNRYPNLDGNSRIPYPTAGKSIPGPIFPDFCPAAN